MAKFKERIAARELRQKGESVKMIARSLKVSKSSVSLWCEDIALSEDQKQKLIDRSGIGACAGRFRAAENKKIERLSRVRFYGKIGRDKVGNMTDRDLFMLGVGLYWAEGSKKGRETKFVNSDPLMIRVWIEWLRRFAGVHLEDLILRIGINEIHEDRIEQVFNFWTKIVGVDKNQFRKTSYKKVHNHKIYSNFESHYGTLMVTVRKGTNLNYEILGMIDALGVF